MTNQDINNKNIQDFATELSEITGQYIGLDHIHPSTNGRYYYIQAPTVGNPLLLHHYRSPFFVDIHPDDYNRIVSGEISAHEYINSANWLVGYYWGGAFMIGGGYYQPLDIIGRKEEVRRYLKILACRGYNNSSGYIPTEERCLKCSVESCPFSKYKAGRWENEPIQEYDPRVEFFESLKKKFEKLFPGYTLRILLSSFKDNEIKQDVAIVRAIARWNKTDPYGFTVWIDSTLVRSILTRQIQNFDELVGTFKFRYSSEGEQKDVTLKWIEEVFEKDGMDRPIEEAREKALLEKRAEERAKWGIFGFVYDIIHS